MSEIGTVRREGARRWVADLKPPCGRRVRRVCRTKTAALAALAKLRAEHLATPPDGPTVRQVLDAYADQLAARARPRSQKAARQGAAILGRVLGHVAVENLTTRALDDFVVAERARGLRPTSINSRLRLLKSALRSAVDAGDLPGLPCRVKLLKEPRRMPSTPERGGGEAAAGRRAAPDSGRS